MPEQDIANNSTIFPDAIKTSKDSFNANGSPLIKVIGVGGGGNNAVNHMFGQNISGVSFVVTNTDRQALVNSPVPTQVLLGPTVTKGLGAGNKPEKAKAAAEESEAEIAELFDEDTKMVFITAGMGGGTGTGASPVVARIARECGKLTVGIVTIPFLFEGEKKIVKALTGADEMSKYVDAMLIINNERLTEIYSELDFDNAFEKADETLTNAARSISELINFKGKINLDFEDVNTTLKDGGTAIISTGYGEGEGRVSKAIEDALNSPLLKNRDIQSSKRFLFNLYYAKETTNPMKMGEMNEFTAFMNNFAKDVDVIWGTTVDNSLGDRMKITILASGFDISLSGDLQYTSPKRPTKKRESEAAPVVDTSRIAEEYGEEKVAEMNRTKASINYIMLNAEQMDNDVLISFFEKTPTYRRGVESKLREEWKALVEAQSSQPLKPQPLKPQPKADEGLVIEFD